jgi:hypothetical protein
MAVGDGMTLYRLHLGGDCTCVEKSRLVGSRPTYLTIVDEINIYHRTSVLRGLSSLMPENPKRHRQALRVQGWLTSYYMSRLLLAAILKGNLSEQFAWSRLQRRVYSAVRFPIEPSSLVLPNHIEPKRYVPVFDISPARMSGILQPP